MFQVWNDLIPASIKDICDYKKLTFYLHVHFAVIPFRNKNTSVKQDERADEVKVATKVVVSTGNNNRSKMESITKDVARLDVIQESVSPCVEYDTDSLDQSQVVLETDKNDKADETKAVTEEPVVNDTTALETGMDVLKTFLASEGETYSPQQEFLPFFALPYVPNPDEHSSFTSLFQVNFNFVLIVIFRKLCSSIIIIFLQYLR